MFLVFLALISNRISIILGIFFLSSFIYNRSHKSILGDYIPLGTIEVDTNLFVDYAEVRNLDYLEFMAWTKRVYGSSSNKYKSILPSDNLWIQEEYCLHSYNDSIYLKDPTYRNYPVVGVSQKQARYYCKWRSDRVFEYILIENEVIEFQSRLDSTNFFTIQKFYNNEYVDNPCSIISKYPQYSLPTELQWRKALTFFKSYNKGMKCRNKHCELHVDKDSMVVQYNVNTCVGDMIVNSPLKVVHCYKRFNIGTHMYGNVSEWLLEEGDIIGGNWKDSIYQDLGKVKHSNEPACNIGFRSVCVWKVYKKL